MEKEISIGNVNFQPTKTGKDKWVIATSDGNLSVWDGEMAEQLNKIVGQSVKVDIRPAAPNTNYLPTITKVDFDSAVKGKITQEQATADGMADGSRVYQEVHDGVRSLNGQEQLSLLEEADKEIVRLKSMYSKDKSIIAQCLVKAVIGQNHENVVLIGTAVNMYKEALKLIG